ncbi:MAG: 1-phosphofructokinase [Candidatus Caenarcaniphilales bacterium]|nr:1-phosphofructokinase [Candidatus Caenarcaniphilales bacterium]
MIYTVTLNPSLDRVIWVDEIKTDDSIRIQTERDYAGGKGIDASRVVKTLGGDTIATGFLGSFTGLHLEGLLINEGVTCDFVKIAQETRSNVIIFTNKSKDHIAFNSKGPDITPYDLATLFNKITNLNSSPSFVLLGGSLPLGVTESIYGQLIYALKSKGIKVALDADNEPLKIGLKEKPNLIKPNSHEFQRLIEKKVETDQEIIREGQKFIQQGIEIIIVSMGSRGLVVFDKDLAFHITPPKIEVKSTIGSGDSTLAAFLLGLEQGKKIDECGIMGAAAGAATAMSPGVELVRLNDYEKLFKDVKCEQILI